MKKKTREIKWGEWKIRLGKKILMYFDDSDTEPIWW